MNLSFHPDSRRQLLIWLVASGILLSAVIIFLELAEDVWLNEGFSWDNTLMLGIHNLSQPWLDTFFWADHPNGRSVDCAPGIGHSVLVLVA